MTTNKECTYGMVHKNKCYVTRGNKSANMEGLHNNKCYVTQKGPQK